MILKAERNTDLTDECDVLKSIYGLAASSEMISVIGSVCSITTLSLTEADLNFPMNGRCADVVEGAKPALNIQFVVHNAGKNLTFSSDSCVFFLLFIGLYCNELNL